MLSEQGKCKCNNDMSYIENTLNKVPVVVNDEDDDRHSLYNISCMKCTKKNIIYPDEDIIIPVHDFLKNECSICLDPLEVDDYSILDKCFHKFHDKCISEWFKITGNHICPDCNTVNTARLTIKNNNKVKLPELSIVKIKTVKNKTLNQHKKINTPGYNNTEPITNYNVHDASNRRCNCIIS